MTAAFEQQFQRSGPASPPSSPPKPRVEIDGAAAMRRYSSADAKTMTGAEMFAIIAHLKTGDHVDGALELEKTLLKVKRPVDKKIALMEWVETNVAGCAAPAPLAPLHDSSNTRPMTAPPDAAGIKRKMEAHTENMFSDAPPPPSPRAAAPPAAAAPPRTAPPPPTAPPATRAALDDAAAVSLVEQFASGREHLAMSGAEYYGLIGWLQGQGHGNVEDLLMKVRNLGDKKFHLTQYLKKHAAELVASAAHELAPAVHEPAHPPALGAQPPPAAREAEHAHGGAMQLAPPAAAPAFEAMAAPVDSFVPPAAPSARSADRALVQHAMMLGQTLDRMEETFNFQVECMREDMKKAREQLHMLSMALNRR